MNTIKVPIIIETQCGTVTLIDIMPKEYTSEILKCDEAIVQSARVSYGQQSKGDKADASLVKYLIENDHGTPTESVIFKFHIKCPIFVQRHIVKHRMSTMNEISARYTVVSDEWYIPNPMRQQSINNRQASQGELQGSRNQQLTEEFNNHCQEIYKFYRKMIDSGVAKEQARSILPQAMYTQFYFTLNLRSVMNFCKLRNSPDAQWETQQIAQAIEKIIKQTNPVSYEIFRNKNHK